MKKTSIAMCAVLFSALFISNAFAAETATGDAVETTVATGAVVEATTTTGAEEAKAEEATTTTGTTVEATTGATAEATTGDVTTGTVATGAAETTTGVVATGAIETGAVATGAAEAEKSINDALHAILDEYFEKNASKFNTSKDRKDFFETVKANINKAAENAKENQKEAYAIIKGALETYELK